MNQQPMGVEELKQIYERVQRYCEILNRAIETRNAPMALELYDRIYQKVFERYSRGDLWKIAKKARRDEERKVLEEIMEQTYKIMLELNFPEETA